MWLALQGSGLKRREWATSLEGAADYEHQGAARLALGALLDELRCRVVPNWWVGLAGPYGTGKSYLARGLVADACRAGCRAVYLPEVEMTALLRESVRSDSEFGPVNLQERWRRPSLLVLDDLATERGTDFASQQLYALIEDRYRSGRCTVVTTNLDANRIVEHYGAYGERIVSRIVGMCRGGATWVCMDGPDLRGE